MVGLATCDVQEVVAPPFPKWYVEAPISDPRDGLMIDEIRTGLLDYPHPEHIKRLQPGCVTIYPIAPQHVPSLAKHLWSKGFRFARREWSVEQYISWKKARQHSFESFTVFGRI